MLKYDEQCASVKCSDRAIWSSFDMSQSGHLLMVKCTSSAFRVWFQVHQKDNILVWYTYCSMCALLQGKWSWWPVFLDIQLITLLCVGQRARGPVYSQYKYRDCPGHFSSRCNILSYIRINCVSITIFSSASFICSFFHLDITTSAAEEQNGWFWG